MQSTTLHKKAIFKTPPATSFSAASTPTSKTSGTPKVSTPTVTTTSLGAAPMGAVVVNQGTTTLKHGVIAPRVGGVLELETDKYEAFTGGDNLVGTYVLPLHARQHRPVRFTDQDAFMDTLKGGISVKLPGPKEKGPQSFTIVYWFQQLAAEIVKCAPDSCRQTKTEPPSSAGSEHQMRAY